MAKLIPQGYGYTNLKIISSHLPSALTAVCDFNQDSELIFKEIEVARTWVTTEHKNIKVVLGYHIKFEMSLVDYDLGLNIQNNILRFILSMRLSTATNKEFSVTPFCSSDDFWGTIFANKTTFTVIATEPPYVKNIVIKLGQIGQVLKIKAITKNMIPISDWNYLITRNATSGAWGYHSTGEYTIGASVPVASYVRRRIAGV